MQYFHTTVHRCDGIRMSPIRFGSFKISVQNAQVHVLITRSWRYEDSSTNTDTMRCLKSRTRSQIGGKPNPCHNVSDKQIGPPGLNLSNKQTKMSNLNPVLAYSPKGKQTTKQQQSDDKYSQISVSKMKTLTPILTGFSRYDGWMHLPDTSMDEETDDWVIVPKRTRKKNFKYHNMEAEVSLPIETSELNPELPTLYDSKLARTRKKQDKLFSDIQRQSEEEVLVGDDDDDDGDSDTFATFLSVDSLASLIIGLANCTNSVAAFSLINLYMNAEFPSVKKSVIGPLISYITKPSEEDGELERQTGVSEFVRGWKTAICDWKSALKSPIFPILSRLLSAIVSLGICNKSDIEFSVGRFKIFEVNAREKHMSASSVLDAILDTITFFLDGAWACYQYGSLKPLMCASPEHFKMIDEITDIISRMDSYTAGNLERQYQIKDKDFAISIENMMKTVSNFLRTSDDKYEIAVLTKYYERLKDCHIRSKDYAGRGGLQRAPFILVCTHKSGVGKSSVIEILAMAALIACGETPDPDRIVIDNQTEAYDSNYKSNMQILYMDDMANSRPDMSDANPANSIIRVGNNVPSRATMAAIEDKGKIVISPTVVAITSNWPDLNARAYSSHPATILRRPKLFVQVDVKPEFCVEGSRMLDFNKVLAFYGGTLPSIPDVWDLTASKVLPVERGDTCIASSMRVGLRNSKGEIMRNVGIAKMLDFVKERARAHVIAEQHIVDSSKMKYDMKICTKCDEFICVCQEEETKVSDMSVEPKEDLSQQAHDDLDSCGSSYNSDSVYTEETVSLQETDISVTASLPIIPETFVEESDIAIEHYVPTQQFQDDIDDIMLIAPPEADEFTGRIVDGVETHINHVREDSSRNHNIVLYQGNLGNTNRFHHRMAHSSIVSANGRMIVYPNDGLERQSAIGSYFVKEVVSYVGSRCENLAESVFGRTRKVEKSVTDQLLGMFKKYERSYLMRFTNFIPDAWLNTRLCKSLCLAFSEPEIEAYAKKRMVFLLAGMAGVIWKSCRLDPMRNIALASCMGCFFPLQYAYTKFYDHQKYVTPLIDYMYDISIPLAVSTASFYGWRFAATRLDCRSNLIVLGAAIPLACLTTSCVMIRKYAIDAMWRDIVETRVHPRMVMMNISERKKRAIMACLGGAVVVGSTITLIRGLKKVLERQSLLSPESAEDVEVRNSHKPIWRRVVCNSVPCTKACSTVTQEQLLGVVRNNIFSFAITRFEDGKEYTVRCCGLPVQQSYVLMPYHAFCDSNDELVDRGTISYLSKEVDVAGTGSSKMFTAHQVYRVPEYDLAVVHMPFLGPRKDLLKFIPWDITSGHVRSIARRPYEGNLHEASTTLSVRKGGYATSSYTFDFMSLFGISDKKPMVGDCGAIYVSLQQPYQLIGMHVAGSTSTNDETKVVACPLTRPLIIAGIEELAARPTTLSLLSSGTLDLNQSLTPIHLTDVHDKAPVHFDDLEQQTTYTVYGGHNQRSTFRSSVTKSIYSDNVAKTFGVPRKHGKPVIRKSWLPWRTNFALRTRHGVGLPLDLLEVAATDYSGVLKERIVSNPGKVKLGTLSIDEAVNGLPGERFIDQLDVSKAIGYPRIGKKSKFLERGPPRDPWNEPLELDEGTRYDVDRIMQSYDDGEASHVILKSCLKDEPTRFGKEKVRVFESSPTGFTIVVRQLFSRLIAFLQFYPLISEIAVGIDCTSPEWDELEKWLAGDRIFAGDYKSWDQTLCCELILKAVDVLVSIARASGAYTEKELQRMTGVACDIAFATLHFDGTVFQLKHSHISGNALTVIINCICNCLLLRCYYFTMYSEPFRKNVNMITYGDDNKGRVSKDVPMFNMVDYAKWIEDIGMKFTMPDKTSEMVRYFSRSEDVDFLKRKTVYHPDLGYYLGALDEESIFKSLHSYRSDSGLSKEIHMITVMEGALLEWFIHGRKIYELRRSQVESFAKETNLCIPGSNLTYDDHVIMWKKRFKKL